MVPSGFIQGARVLKTIELKKPNVVRDRPRDVAAAFAAFPEFTRQRALEVRDLIFETARSTPEAGPITETVKWGEPAYLTEATGAGTTIRLGWDRISAVPKVLVNCQTTLIDEFRTRFPIEFRYEKTRAILLPISEPYPKTALQVCLITALTYHLRKR